jgi:hypothetical protein
VADASEALITLPVPIILSQLNHHNHCCSLATLRPLLLPLPLPPACTHHHPKLSALLLPPSPLNVYLVIFVSIFASLLQLTSLVFISSIVGFSFSSSQASPPSCCCSRTTRRPLEEPLHQSTPRNPLRPHITRDSTEVLHGLTMHNFELLKQ